MGKGYYSPKIKDEYIPRLYRLSKAEHIPMTKLVNRLIAQGLESAGEGRGYGEKRGDHHRGFANDPFRNPDQT